MVERIRIELPTLLPLKDDKAGDAYLDERNRQTSFSIAVNNQKLPMTFEQIEHLFCHDILK